MKLLCDQMLGTLAKWLRIYGFDTFYANSKIDDKKILDIAKKEKRILITRDKDLINKAKKELIKTIQLKDIGIDNELSIVLNEVKIVKSKILSRCIICNNKIKTVKKEDIASKIPERIFKKHNEFWYCVNCNKVYWKGSHFEKMLEKIKSLS